jgi:hypothetical protein
VLFFLYALLATMDPPLPPLPSLRTLFHDGPRDPQTSGRQLDQFFEPVHEETAFGNLPPDDPAFRQLLFQNREDLWTDAQTTVALTEEERREFDEYAAVANKARERVQNTLAEYTHAHLKHGALSSLQELTDTTLTDMCRKVSFLMDAFQSQMNEDDTYTHQSQETQSSIQALHAQMSTAIQARLEDAHKNLTATKTKLRLLSTMCSLNRHISLGHACPICYDKEVDVYCDPCGHTFCEKCIKSQFCYLCRIKIKKIGKLYFT